MAVSAFLVLFGALSGAINLPETSEDVYFGTRTVKPAIPRRSGLIAVTLSLITPTAGGMRPPAPLRVTIGASPMTSGISKTPEHPKPLISCPR